jgi:hypothetical protein
MSQITGTALGVNDTTGATVLDGADINDGKDVTLGETTGTKFGTASTQKQGWWGATPVVRPSAWTQTYTTASKTVGNPTSATLTDSSGGTANTAIQSIGATYSQTEVRNNFADLTAMVNKLTADNLALTKNFTALLDHFQTLGLLE